MKEDEARDAHRLETLVEVVEEAVEEAVEPARVSLREVVDALGERSLAPLLLVPAVVVVSPLSGIVFVSSLCGIAIALIALQIVIGRSRIWLPDWLLDRRIGHDSVQKVLQRLHGPARRVDGWTRRRLTLLTRPPLDKLPALVCLLLGCAMPFLEVVPFSSSLFGLAIATMALGMLLRDGVFVLAGLVFTAMLIAVGASAATAIWGAVFG